MQKERLFANTARALGDAPDFIKQRHIDNCNKADPEYGKGVEMALKNLQMNMMKKQQSHKSLIQK